ncbi:hypothetical protein L202_04888 [Cryptococcus amylolentus CBS 6039]|uniref:Uncharacterized protein n=1 Tax=Cryptococcus amylolentus CBS 6039 TaxID=1295533 RepID=A0A1E3HN27_9TREE|nr:hypothetical protein L202_04888 [Cryptococcus amylolentus CBS 6039]ODN77753.1 hypothetical protein L202_04888 [Cryptococcus amylolentus CBS 6039]
MIRELENRSQMGSMAWDTRLQHDQLTDTAHISSALLHNRTTLPTSVHGNCRGLASLPGYNLQTFVVAVARAIAPKGQRLYCCTPPYLSLNACHACKQHGKNRL